jgi:hypothetical protein
VKLSDCRIKPKKDRRKFERKCSAIGCAESYDVNGNSYAGNIVSSAHSRLKNLTSRLVFFQRIL